MSTPTAAVEIVEDARFQSHRGPDGHPERPERLVAIGEAIDLYRDRARILRPREATQDEILRVHERRMLDVLEATRRQPPGRLDADTYFSPSSFDVAMLAAGGSAELALRVLRGQTARGLAAVRPPGHHAEAGRSMGFCLLNNVAIAVRAIQAEEPTARILVFDWDVHHGNGTQHSFESDPDVLYISTHQFPFYPGTGDFSEEGKGPGLGTTLNIPLPAGSGDAEYIGVVERLIVPTALAFEPDMILVSCGFDAHRSDPLASMEVTIEGYRAMAMIMRELADSLCDGRLVHVLEGGYALDGVREGALAVLESLTAEASATGRQTRRGPADVEHGTILQHVIDRVVAVHGQRIPNLGARR